MLYRGVFVVLALACGCAEVGLGEPKVVETPIRTARAQVLQKDGLVTSASEDGTTVTVTAVHLCSLVEVTTSRRTTTRQRVNKSPSTDWLAGIGGVATATAGAVVIAHGQGRSSATGGTIGKVSRGGRSDLVKGGESDPELDGGWEGKVGRHDVKPEGRRIGSWRRGAFTTA